MTFLVLPVPRDIRCQMGAESLALITSCGYVSTMNIYGRILKLPIWGNSFGLLSYYTSMQSRTTLTPR